MNRSILILCFLLHAGCGVIPTYPSRVYQLDPVTVTDLPGSEAVLLEASAARWNADAARLAVDVIRAVERSDWALLEVTGATGIRAQSSVPSTHPIRAEALLPDNRVAVIHVWGLSENEVAAAVMVGRFGDRRKQERFLQILADTLADKPKPKRGGGFELPD